MYIDNFLKLVSDCLQDMLFNLVCSLKKNKINNYVIGALDRKVYAKLLARNLPTFPGYALESVDKDVKTGYFGSQ